MATGISLYEIRDELVRLSEHDSGAFCDLIHEVGEDLKGARHRKAAGPFARAAVEAGHALAEVRLRYGREADAISEMLAEAAGPDPAAALLAA